jgi:TRAP-type C4-dicarboxylate transport system permease small subunit
MAHGLDAVETAQSAASAVQPADAGNFFDRILASINYLVVLVSSIALVVASIVLTYSVATRYFLKYSTDWQDETAVFLIVGAVFMSAAAIQQRRGHVAIEAIVGLLSPGVNRVRVLLVDIASLAFCGFFSWKSWTLCMKRLSTITIQDRPGTAAGSIFAHGSRHALLSCNCCCGSRQSFAGPSLNYDGTLDRPTLRCCDAAGDVCRDADRICSRRSRGAVHDFLHAGGLGRYHHAKCLRGDGVDHVVVDPAVHPQGRGDWPVARR